MRNFVPLGINPEGVTSASAEPHHSRSVPPFDKLRANGAEFPFKRAKCRISSPSMDSSTEIAISITLIRTVFCPLHYPGTKTPSST